MRAFVVLASGIAAFLAAGPLRADELTLTWRAPSTCPPAERVRAAALEGAKGAKGDPIAADAQVESDRSDRWHVTLTTTRAGVTSSARRIDARSCEALADATAVILALALIPPGASEDPAAASASASASASAPASASAAASAPASAYAPASASASAPASAPSSPSPPPSESPLPSSLPLPSHALAIAAGLTSDASTLPSAAIGGAASFAWTPGRARVEMSGSFFAGQSKTTGLSPAGASLSLVAVGLRGCYAILKSRAIELSPCAGADLSNVSASGFGAAANYDASARWVSATGGAFVRVPLASLLDGAWGLALRAQVDANVPLSRPTFVVDGEGAVHRPSAMGARGGIGLELDFL